MLVASCTASVQQVRSLSKEFCRGILADKAACVGLKCSCLPPVSMLNTALTAAASGATKVAALQSALICAASCLLPPPTVDCCLCQLTLTKELLRAHRYDQARHWLLSREEDWPPCPELYWDFLHFLGAAPGSVVLDEAPEEKLTPEVKLAPANLFWKHICAAEVWPADSWGCASAHLPVEVIVQSKSSTAQQFQVFSGLRGQALVQQQIQ